MSELRCPFCQQELKHETTTGIYCCKSVFVDCPLGLGTGAFGTKELWQELIRTRKALEKAKSVLKNLNDYAILDGFQERDVEEALAEITALEQKGE